MEKFLTLRAIEIMEACQGFRDQGLSASRELIAMEDEAIRDLADFTLDGSVDTVIRLKRKHKVRLDQSELQREFNLFRKNEEHN